MIREYIGRIMNHEVSIQERMFRLITGIGIVILGVMTVAGLVFGKNIENIAVMAACFFYMLFVTWFSLTKERVKIGSVLVACLFVILIPLLFFTSGGIGGSSPLWLCFFFIYISLTLYGVQRIFFLAVCAAATFLCYYFAYRHPEFVIQHTLDMAYTDSAAAVILVGMLVSIMALFQNHIYKEQSRISNEQKKEIEELHKAETNFFSSMSHEIRTPINTIIGLNEIILRSEVSEEVAENAKNIQGASKMLLTLINDILDMSKMESGKMDIVNVSYETGVFFSDITNMIWVRAQEKGLEFHLDIDPSMPSQLCGDEVRIKQILVNLLNNSVKYTKKGSVTLTVRCEHISVNQVRVSYTVQDTGQGIKQEDIPYLFSAFKRVDEDKNRHIEGTGLGLSIVKQLVELMGGEISVNSVYTKGSSFHVALKQDIIDNRELGNYSLKNYIHKENQFHHVKNFEAPDARILIVDDNNMNLVVASKLLSDTKIQIDTASSGAECLKMTLNTHYDGILMDHLMPEMNGIECLHALRSQINGMCQNVPVIALTANAGSDNQLLYQQEGFNGYLAKPVNGALLEAAVLNILPKELVVLNEAAGEMDLAKEVIVFEQKERIALMITTDSVSDIPKELAKKLGVAVCAGFVKTDKGRFLSGTEMDTESLLAYLKEGGSGISRAPDVEDYISFFADKLTEAQNIIHIAMAKHGGEEYQNATEAARSFENVTVLDSGHLSSGQGLAVLYAAHMARQHDSKEEVIQMVETLKNRISTSFIVGNTRMLYRAGRLSKNVHTICEALLLHPVIVLHKSRMTVGGIRMGRYDTVMKQYIRMTLKNKASIDRRILFIVYVGLDAQHLLDIQKMVQQYCPFERVYLQQASASIAINCGEGSFGLLFMRSR